MRNIKNNVDLEWNVFVPDMNKRQMKVFNIFNHISYKQEIIELLNHKDDYTLEEFREKVKETHGDNRYAKEYLMIADLMEMHFRGEEE